MNLFKFLLLVNHFNRTTFLYLVPQTTKKRLMMDQKLPKVCVLTDDYDRILTMAHCENRYQHINYLRKSPAIRHVQLCSIDFVHATVTVMIPDLSHLLMNWIL